MKSELTNRARGELLLALHKLDEFEDGQCQDASLFSEIRMHVGAAATELFRLKRLSEGEQDNYSPRQIKAANFSTYGSQQSQSGDQL